MDESGIVFRVVIYVIVAIFGTGGAIAGIWGLLKILIPRIIDTKLEQEKKRLDAELEEKKDKREFSQEERKIELSLRQAEATEAQRMLGDIVTQLQDSKEKSDQLIRNDVKEALARIEKILDTIPKIQIDILEIKLQHQTITTKFSLVSNIIERTYEQEKLEGQGHDKT